MWKVLQIYSSTYEKRLTEIEDLDERKDAREILLEGLVPIFERMENGIWIWKIKSNGK